LQKGIAVATIGYRLNSSSPFPDQNRDISCALEYLDDHADTLHINPRKVVYFGDSAGGQLAAFAALNIPYDGHDYEAPVGVIDFYGVSDFSRIVDGAHPDLFVHGTRDTVIPISQSLSFYNQLTAVGIDAEYLTVNGAKHAFNGPGLLPETYKKITTTVDSFLKETIQK
jgi:acetyl esterase/lipase